MVFTRSIFVLVKYFEMKAHIKEELLLKMFDGKSVLPMCRYRRSRERSTTWFCVPDLCSLATPVPEDKEIEQNNF